MPSNRPEIVLIAAVAERNRVIGQDQDLPWHIPADLKRFKRLTIGHPMLMGRKTFESLVDQFNGPLPNRRNLVLTSQGPFDAYPDVDTFTSIPEALDAVRGTERLFIGGGEAVYTAFLPLADRLELTLVEGDYTGDAYFPRYTHLLGRLFEVAEEQVHDGFRFVTYRRLPYARTAT